MVFLELKEPSAIEFEVGIDGFGNLVNFWFDMMTGRANTDAGFDTIATARQADL